MTADDLAGAVRADSLALLDEQVANLSERVFELGRAAAVAHGRSAGVPDAQLDWPA